MDEVNADREEHGKKPFDDDNPSKPSGKKRDNTSKKKLARRKKGKTRTMTKSVTDPFIDCVDADVPAFYAYYFHTG